MQTSYQNVVVMRHGDRKDNVEPLWTAKAARPWDPPLADEGRVRAFCMGRKFRTQLGFPIHRVFVSPFLRCLQTAAEVVSALCAVEDGGHAAVIVDPDRLTSDGVQIDPSKLKVSIEYGLCEMLNEAAIRPNVAPKDGEFGFNISELEALLPAGTVDNSLEEVYPELPQWGEGIMDARARYAYVIKALADKYPSENLLLVSHAEGVGVAFTEIMKDVLVNEVEYCGHTHSRRPIVFGDDKSFTAGDFELIPKGQIGIRYGVKSVSDTDGPLSTMEIE